jgi:hypothetical protein
MMLEKILELKSQGDQSALEGDPLRASTNWTAANVILLRSRNLRTWPAFLQDAGKDYADHLTSLFFQIHSNMVQALLAAAAETEVAGRDAEGFKTLITQIFGSCVETIRAARTLGTDWSPSHDQLATVFYCWAKAHRIAERDIHVAENMICRAAALRPGDMDIGLEMMNIIRWKASVGLP